MRIRGHGLFKATPAGRFFIKSKILEVQRHLSARPDLASPEHALSGDSSGNGELKMAALFHRKFLGLVSLFLVFAGASAHAAVGVSQASNREIKTFDGQVMRCESRNDQGRMGFQVTSIQGEIRPPNLEVQLNLVTMKCVDRAGIFRFEPSALGARVPNSRDGFVEFSNLELVAYSPDLKVVRSLPVDLRSSNHRLILVAPASGFAGLLPRNANGNGERQVILMAMLRGQALMGQASTGKVMHRAQAALGTFGLKLSESAGTLRIGGRRLGNVASATQRQSFGP